MFDTVRFFIILTFSAMLFGVVGLFIFIRVPADFKQCKEIYKIETTNSFTITKTPYTKKENECVKNREDLANFETCLAQAAMKNNFPVTVLTFVGKVSELRSSMKVACASVVF